MTQDPTPSPSYSVDDYTEAELQVFDRIMETTNASGRSSTPVGNTSSAARQSSISPSKRPIKLKEGAPPGLHRVAEERAQSAAEERAQLSAQLGAQSANEEETHLAAPPLLDHRQSQSPGPFGVHTTTYNHPPQPLHPRLPHPLYPHPHPVAHPHPHPVTPGLHSTSPVPPSAPNTGPQFSYHAHSPHPHPASPSLHSTSPVPTSAANPGHNFSYPAPQHGPHTTGSSGYPYPPPPQAYLQPYGYAQPYGPQHSVPPQPQNMSTGPTSVAPTAPTAATATVPLAAPATTSSISPTTQRPIPANPSVPATTNASSMAESLPSASQSSVADTKDSEEGASDEEDIPEDENMLGSEGLPGLDELSEDHSSPGGRPSKKKLDACDRICKKLGEWVIAESKAEGVEASDIYDRFGGKVLRAQRRKSRWNGYQSYAAHPTYKGVELGHLEGSDCPWDGESNPTTLQLRTAYKLFIKEKGEDEARSLMDVWNMLRTIEAVQKKGERKRTFKAIVSQLKNFAEYIRNRYNIHLWAIIAGGQIRSDQLYTFVCGLHESAGFAKGALAVGEDDIGELFQSWIFNRNAAKFTNQQIAAMAHERGLKVTGPGIDEEMGPSATTPSTSTPLPTPEIRITTRPGAPTKKAKKENVRATIRVAVKTL
ncbi:hypothetical protein PQX77_002590 [Marasmius sp. AFHP31]|nr:hypothetical protein PQX77_002590 [Marasmius sp. AFHP31]